MGISISASGVSDHDQGRAKFKTKALDGTIVDDEDGPDIFTTTTTTTPPSPGRSKRGHSWRGGDRGVPSWLEGSFTIKILPRIGLFSKNILSDSE